VVINPINISFNIFNIFFYILAYNISCIKAFHNQLFFSRASSGWVLFTGSTDSEILSYPSLRKYQDSLVRYSLMFSFLPYSYTGMEIPK